MSGGFCRGDFIWGDFVEGEFVEGEFGEGDYVGPPINQTIAPIGGIKSGNGRWQWHFYGTKGSAEEKMKMSQVLWLSS